MKSTLSAALLLAAASPAFAQEQAAKSTDLWQIIQSGGPVMYPLGAVSILALMLIFIYLMTMRRAAVVSNRYMQAADTLIGKGDYIGLLALSNRHNEAIASVMERALNFLASNPTSSMAEVREIAEAEGIRLAGLWNQRISYLADIGSIAPMLGLLGTVLGMITSFTVVANDVVSSRPMMLAGGVAEALITTAAGLLIGIPVMAAYAFFRGRVQGMISDLEAASTVLLAHISVSKSKK
jgi:biopolymer transport protein ExbB